MVGVAEFESTASCAQGRRSTRLSYTPRRLFGTAGGNRIPVVLLKREVLGQRERRRCRWWSVRDSNPEPIA